MRQQALENSLRTALHMGYSDIGTEQLLLGLLRDEGSVGAQLIVSLGVEVSVLRSATVKLIFD